MKRGIGGARHKIFAKYGIGGARYKIFVKQGIGGARCKIFAKRGIGGAKAGRNELLVPLKTVIVFDNGCFFLAFVAKGWILDMKIRYMKSFENHACFLGLSGGF
ncbi:hypothetical protein ACKX2L_05740 [Lachnospiraceae bacterium YH-ros2228]